MKSIRTDVLDIAYEEHGPRRRRAGHPAARLPLRRARLRRGGAGAGGRRQPRARAVAARLRPHAVPVAGHAALGRAGGARQRSAPVHGRAWHRARGAGGLRLGRPGGLRRLGALARARALPGELHRLQSSRTSQHRTKPASAGAGASLWYQYYFNTDARHAPASTKNRRDICRLLWTLWSPNWTFDDATFEKTRAVVRQSRLRRRGDPVLPPSLRLRRAIPR